MRQILFVTLIFATSVFGMSADAATLSPAPSASGLLGYWSFNEGTSTKAVDYSGRGAIATINNNAVPSTSSSGWTSGKLGSAFVFDGTDDYAIATAPQTGVSDWSIAAWFKANTLPQYAMIVHNGNDSGGYGFGFTDGGGFSGGSTLTGLFGTVAWLDSGQTLVAGQWYHFVMTRTGGVTRMYLDGTLLGSTFAQTPNAIGSYISMGSQLSSGDTPTRYFNGSVDEVRIYNRAITAAEVLKLYRASSTVRKGVTQNGLVGHWRFDEGTSTKVIDSSGNGNTGTLTNMDATTDWVTGKFDRALDFDGTNDYVSASTGQTFDQGFTVSFWAKPTSNPGSYKAFVIGHNTSDDYSQGFVIDMGNSATSDWSYIGIEGAGMSSNVDLLNTSFPFNTWHHIVVDFAVGTNAVLLYADGVLSGTRTRSAGTINAQNIKIGARHYNSSVQNHFPGIIDDVRVYNRSLSAAEVVTLYQSGAAIRKQVSERGLVGYWRFDEGTSTKAIDFSGNGNTGTLNSMANPSTPTSGWGIGKIGGGLNFDGSDDNVTFTNINRSSITTEASLVFWIKLTSHTPSQSAGFGWTTSSSADHYPWASDGGIYAGTFKATRVSVGAGIVTDRRRWHQVAFTTTPGAGGWKFYQNGTLVTTSTGDATVPIKTSPTLTVSSGSGTHSATIDNVRLYNRVLSAEEIRTLYEIER